MSVGLITPLMLTIDESERVPSFTPPSMAVSEWQSMMPGMRYLPVASTMVASAGALTSLPTAAIFPFSTRTLPFWTVPFVTVRTVALRMRTVWADASDVAQKAMQRAEAAFFITEDLRRREQSR